MVSVLLSDNNSFYFNPAQLGFNDNRFGSITFYPVSLDFFVNGVFRSENATINLSKIILPHESNINLVAGVQRNIDRKSTRLNSSHIPLFRMPSSA